MRSSHMGVFALATCIYCGTVNAIDLSVVAPATNVQVGDLVPVDLVVSGLDDFMAPSLGAYDINLNFDGGVLNLVSVEFGVQLDVFGVGWNIQSSFSGPGTVNLFEVSIDDPVALENLQLGSFSLATLTFQVSTVGSSALQLGVNSFADSWGTELPVNLVNSAVTAVPEPSSALLMLLGLLPVGLAVRRFRPV